MTDGKEDTFAAMFEKQVTAPRRRQVRVGDRLEAIVVQVGKDLVFVELDGKQQAFLEAAELREPDGTIALVPGDTVAAPVGEVDARRGVVRLGRSMGRPGTLAALEQARAAGVAVDGKVTGVNKGGLEVDVGGTRAFCPMSQVDARRVEDADARGLIGQTLRFLVTDIRDGGKNVVVSRRAVLASDSEASAARTMSKVVPGAVLQGTVTGVRDFGAFVDLGGGVEGLLPRSEVSHDRSVAIGDALRAGDTVEVQVREIKDRKITLSLKALAADPWADLDVAPGKVARGIVARVTDIGRFVRLSAGVEGLLHVSELARSAPGQEGEEILVVVKHVDKVKKKISLAPAPAGAAVGAIVATGVDLVVGAIVGGVVTRIETFGVFVQIDGTSGRAGRGLVPQAELGVPRGTDLRKAFPDATRVVAKVLETGDGRLRLSIKGAKDAEERADFEEARGKANAPASLGTFADLLKGRRLGD